MSGTGRTHYRAAGTDRLAACHVVVWSANSTSDPALVKCKRCLALLKKKAAPTKAPKEQR